MLGASEILAAARVKSCQSARLNQPCRLVKLPAKRAVKSSAGFARLTFEPALVRVIYGSQGRKPLVVNKGNKSPHLCGRHNHWPRKKALLHHEATGYATRACAGSGMFVRGSLGLMPQATICRPHKCGLKSTAGFARQIPIYQPTPSYLPNDILASEAGREGGSKQSAGLTRRWVNCRFQNVFYPQKSRRP